MFDLDLSSIGGLAKDLREAITGEAIKDQDKRDEMNYKLKVLEQTAKDGQIAINKVEAANPNVFISGWRPAVGWVGVVALFMVYVPKAIVVTSIWTYQCIVMIQSTKDMTGFVIPAFPDLGVTDLIGLLGAMLGFGAMRMYEKSKGIDTKRIG